MIAKRSAGNTLYGALAYNQKKVDDAHAKVILANKMIEPADGNYDINTCLRSFEPYLAANQKTEKPILHVSINPDPKDVLTDDQLSEIAQEYMQQTGYGDQPFIVYKHEDIERKHIHIVSLRVDENGKKINDQFEYRRSMKACRELERKYGLVSADQKQRQAGLPLKPVRYEDGDVKHQIANVIRPIALSWHFQSLKEYRALLSIYNINVEEVRGETNGKEYQGLVYSALNERGEKAGNPFKSSLFGKTVGVEALEKRIEQSTEIMKNKDLKTRSKGLISATLRTCRRRQDFEKALGQQGISVLFRENEQGRIYGVTFIDHEQKCVFNGSRLGKEFSANGFNERFNGSGQRREQSGNHEAGQAFEPFENARHDREEGSGIGGLFDLFSPEAGNEAADNAEERAFIRRLKRKKRPRRIY